MVKPLKHRKRWSYSDVEKLKKFAKAKLKTQTIAKKLQRTENSIRNKADEKKISLKPKDR